MAILELLFSTLLLSILVLLLLLPLGHLVLTRFFACNSINLEVLAAYGVSLLCYAALMPILLSVGLPQEAISWLLLLVVATSFFFWFRGKYWLRVVSSGSHFECLVLLAYVLLCTLTAAFPDGSIDSVSIHTSMALSSLAIDNLIPYNVARYLLEGIPMADLPVVPDWSAGDRGPLAGLFVATFFSLLQLRDLAAWDIAAPGLVFVYHVVLSVLNGLAVVAVANISREVFGRRSAAIALLLLLTTHFCFVNVLFSWPKFLVAYFFLTGLTFLIRPHSRIVAGAFLAAALLSHDSALFCVLGVFAAVIIQLLMRRRLDLLRQAAVLALCFSLLYAPWPLYKALRVPSANKLVLLHVFDADPNRVADMTFRQAADEYFVNNSAAELLRARWVNLTHPFDLSYVFRHRRHWQKNPKALVEESLELSFNRIILSLGVWTFLLLLLSLFQLPKGLDPPKKKLIFGLLAGGYGGLLVSTALFGANPMTLTYVWGYPAFAVSVIPVAGLLSKASILSALTLGLVLACNLAQAVLLFFLSGWTKVASFVDYQVLLVQVVLGGILFLGLLYMVRATEREQLSSRIEY